MVVEIMKLGECTCKIDDVGYVGKSKEEIERIINDFSEFILECLQRKETA